jgi:hypothetical protein
MYRFALLERKSRNQVKKRDGCENAYIASAKAIDEFLEAKGLAHVPKGTVEASKVRWDGLDRLYERDPELSLDLQESFGAVEDILHGVCFYQGIDSPSNDLLIKKNVRNILEKTGHPLDFED